MISREYKPVWKMGGDQIQKYLLSACFRAQIKYRNSQKTMQIKYKIKWELSTINLPTKYEKLQTKKEDREEYKNKK